MANNRFKNKRKLQANRQRGSSASSNYGYRLTGGYHCADTKRDVWEVAGYPAKVDFDMHKSMKSRFGIANAGIYLLPDKCWQSSPIVTDGEKGDDDQLTDFEKDLEVLIKKHHLFARFKGADWRNRVGRYSGILPIVKESQKTKPEDKPSKSMGIESLIKLMPLMEDALNVDGVSTYSELDSENYGMPMYYNLRSDEDRNPLTNETVKIHPDRVFIFAEGSDDGSIFGIPANEAGFNALLDMEKTGVAGSEGYYKNSKQRLVHNIQDNQVASTLAGDKDAAKDWEENNANFASGFDSSLVTYGIDTKQLQSTLSDPTHPFTVSLNIYAASLGIPGTEIIGVQMNKQASETNASTLNEVAESRRVNTLTPAITGFLMYLVDRGIMRAPTNDIVITWPSLAEPSTGAKLDNSKKMQDVNKIAFDTGRGEPVFTEEEIRKGEVMEVKPKDDEEMFGEDDDDDTKSMATE